MKRSTPNLLVIMSDDHAAHAFGAMGNSVVHTPHLDRLAADGFLGTNTFCPAPMCTPSRQAVLTGRLPHAVGVPYLTSAMPDGTYTVAHHLAGRGWRTAAIGKMHFNSELHHGFADRVDRDDYVHSRVGARRLTYEAWPGGRPWKPFVQPARLWLNAAVEPAPQTYAESEAAFFVNSADRFFASRADDREPFALWLSFYEPHSPYVFPTDNPVIFDPSHIDLPEVSPRDTERTPAIFAPLSEDERRGVIAAYYSSVAHLDRAIGAALGSLQRHGLSDNTIVVYIPDHGYLLGQHARFEKHCFYEEAVRIPLIIRWPAAVPAGRSSDAFVQSHDLAPTLCELLEIDPLPNADGLSVASEVTGHGTGAPREAIYSEYLHTESVMWRDADWKLIVSTGELEDWYAPSRGGLSSELELYHLASDPRETRNLADDPRHGERVESLATALDAYMETHATMPLTTAESEPLERIRSRLRYYRYREEGRL